ncbi:MAG: CYTH domain-containing protein [Butyricicoccaceae bacterium]
MEKEYKWRADELLLNRAPLWAPSRIGSQSRTIRMESSYFDTADGMPRNKKAALRLRRENERTVCCMKLRGEEESTDGLRAHEEYQCDAGTLEDGLRQLPEKARPRRCAANCCTRSSRRFARSRSAAAPYCFRSRIRSASLRSTRVSCAARVGARRCARSSWNMSQATKRRSMPSPPSWPTSSTLSPRTKASLRGP